MGALCAGAPAEGGGGRGALAAAFVRAAAARPRGGRFARSSRWAPVTQLRSDRRRCAGGFRPRGVVVLFFFFSLRLPSSLPFRPPAPAGRSQATAWSRGTDGYLTLREWGGGRGRGDRGSVAGPRACTEQQK